MMESGARWRRISLPLDFLLVFLLTAALIWPLFKIKYADKWASIESTFIADARFLKEHWPHPQWQPLWYGGTRFDYVYPPALRYGTAALAKFYPMTEARAYHLYTAIFYCLGISGVYLFVRIASGHRAAAWLAAAAAALLSPSFLVLSEVRHDAWLHHPVRLGALVRYGEGPHMTAVALLPFALVAAFFALRRWRPGAMAAAGISSALVVANNFYGATALAITFPILVWSLWITHRDNRIWLRSLAIPALAYGLIASWFTPSYLRVTLNNMRLVSNPGNKWSIWLALAVLAVYLLLTVKWANRKPEFFYGVFVSGFCLFFCLNVLGNHFFGFRVMGEPGRLIPELDLAIILLVVEAARRLWSSSSKIPRAAAAAIVLLSFATAVPYVRRAWQIIVPDPAYEDRIEYKMSEWMAAHLPGARAMATGSVRFWYNAWHNLPQLGGGSEQGSLNQLVNLAYSKITSEPSVEQCIEWLQAYGVDAVIVHDQTSQEEYKDFADPRKFAGALPVLYDTHHGDVIYGVPRRYPDLGRVVETSRVLPLHPMTDGDVPVLRAYAEALEKGPETRAVTAWEGTDDMRVTADIAAGQSVVVQIAYDPQWRARSGRSELSTREDAFGQMLIETPPGRHDIRLHFETPLENQIGKAVTLLSLLIVIFLFGKRVAP